MAQNRDARATLTIDGPGSQLIMTGAFADVGTGAGGRATLDVLNGALIDGNNSVFRVGSGQPEDFSVLRIKGPGSLMNDAGVIVQTGGLLEVREEARWAGTNSLLEVKGGTATFNHGTAKLRSLIVSGQFNGERLVSTGQVNIDNGSVIDATGANLVVGGGGRLSLTGSGSRLFGFSDLLVNGNLVVNSGTTLEGDTLGLKSDSALQGTGTVIVNTRFTAEGQIKPGNSPGVLRIEGDVLLTDTSELVLELAGTAAGTQHDVLEVQGSLTLQGGRVSLAFIDGFAPLQGQQFVLLDVSGSFQSSAAIGVTGLADGWQFSTGFDPVTGELTLTSLSNGVSAVPEPATWLLWGAGLGLCLLRRRRA
jgi:T5SS/PEP-CTERM-associated repeat protein